MDCCREVVLDDKKRSKTYTGLITCSAVWTRLQHVAKPGCAYNTLVQRAELRLMSVAAEQAVAIVLA